MAIPLWKRCFWVSRFQGQGFKIKRHKVSSVPKGHEIWPKALSIQSPAADLLFKIFSLSLCKPCKPLCFSPVALHWGTKASDSPQKFRLKILYVKTWQKRRAACNASVGLRKANLWEERGLIGFKDPAKPLPPAQATAFTHVAQTHQRWKPPADTAM